MKIYTYHSNLAGNNPEHATKLLLLWKENWKHFGLEPIVLNEYIAREHPLFEAMNQKIGELPTINPPDYERACYLRYLAMSQVEGGLHSDHDLFCYVQPNFGKPTDKLVSFQTHIPSLLHGNKNAYEAAIAGIMAYQVSEKDLEGANQPHVSDMHMFLRGGIPFTSRNEVRNYLDPGWEKSKFVHFSNGSTKPAGKSPRHLHIKQLRNW